MGGRGHSIASHSHTQRVLQYDVAPLSSMLGPCVVEGEDERHPSFWLGSFGVNSWNAMGLSLAGEHGRVACVCVDGMCVCAVWVTPYNLHGITKNHRERAA
jgi:hypothetical protein